jgi:multidrug efflux pump subunit AcrA (membrane-fusion protein)
LARPVVSIVLTEPPPPEPSMIRTIGRRETLQLVFRIIFGPAGMKMEIGASSERGGIVKSILVKPDEVVEEGQVVAIVES